MIPIDLSNKTALVCGSTQGIGLAIAESFARAGASVILAARNEERLAEVAKSLPTINGSVHSYICADFSDLERVREELKLLMEKKVAIDILVNNTGGPAPGPITEANEHQLLNAFSQHLLISQMMVQQVLPGMKERNYGRIINVISTSVKQPIPNLGVSNTIRAAMAGWSKTLSMEVASHGVTVNNLLPGFIQTGRLDSLIANKASTGNESPESIRTQLMHSVPAGKFGSPEDLGNFAAFLASPLAGYVNGTNIPIDGARTSAF